MYIAICLLLLM